LLDECVFIINPFKQIVCKMVHNAIVFRHYIIKFEHRGGSGIIIITKIVLRFPTLELLTECTTKPF